MGGLAPLDFSLVIAFLLPGFVSLYALSFVSPRVSMLMNALAGKDATVGTSLAVLLFALAAGVMTSGVRALMVDWLQHKTGVNKPALNFGALAQTEVLAAFKEAVGNVYRFAQFYGNMFVSLLLVAALKFGREPSAIKSQLELFILTVSATVILFLSHRRSLRETYDRLTDIVGTQHKGGVLNHGKEDGKETRKEDGKKDGEETRREDHKEES